MRRIRISALLAGAASLVAVTVAGPHAQTREQDQSLTIVLDSSRSMWGQIDGVNKVVIARNVLEQVTKTYEGKLDLGLVAYGHRESNSCEDVEVLAKTEPYKAAEFAKAVNSIKPKGSTPIATSLETAAESAGYTKRTASLLLVSDGLDNCSGDPCATARALHEKASDLTIHVVAFDRGDQDSLKNLSCIAEETGGIFSPATNEAELHSSISAIFQKAMEPPIPAVTPVAEPAPAPVAEAAPPPPPARNDGTPPAAAPPAPQPPADPQSQKADRGGTPRPSDAKTMTPVNLRAKLTETGGDLTSGVVWRVYDATPDAGGNYKLLDTQRAAILNHALPPGEYMINAAYGLANVTRKVTVEAGQSLVDTVVINAGGLRLGAQLANGDPLPPNSVRYDIFAGEADQFGNRNKILGDAKPGLIIRLNAGAYHIVSVYGDANAVVRADVAVEAGRLTEATINHSAAKVSFRLVMQPGGEAMADTQWNVLTPGGDVVKESAGALPTHVLQAGEYSVLARHQGKNYTREFEVKPGETQQVEVVIR